MIGPLPLDFDFSEFKPDKLLQRYYNRYNKKFFGGMNRHVQVGWNSALTHTKCVGITVAANDDVANSLTFTIQLDPWLQNSDFMKLTLLHEMCHVQLHPYRLHGKRFDQAMLMLAAKGAMNGIW